MVSLVDTAMSDPGALNETHYLLLALLVTDLRVRDLAWALISPDERGGACSAVGCCGGDGAADVGSCTAVPAGPGCLGLRSWRTTELLLRAVGTGRSGLLPGEIAPRHQRTSASSIPLATDGR